tara:strand:- start:155 stop:2707 length:2553 start_codon:yes stop_codon:yes gene_type:complete
VASAEARIDIVVKNLGSVERLSKTLDKVNATNIKLIQSIDRATRAIDQFAKTYSGQVTPAVQATTKAAQEQNNVLAKIPSLLTNQLTGIQKIQKAYQTFSSVLKSALNPVAALIGGELLRGVIDINMHFDKFKNILIGAQVPLKEINGYILEAKTTMSQFHSSTEEAASAAYDLVIALEAVNKETAEQQNLINAARGRTSRSLPGGRVYGFNNVPTVDQANVNRRDREIARRAAEQRENRLFFTDTEGTYGRPGSKQSILLKEIDNLYAKTKSHEEALFKTRLQKEELIHQKRLKNNALANQALLDDFDRRLAAATQLPPTITNATQYAPGAIGPQQLPLVNRLGFGRNANPRGVFASRGGMGGRGRGAFSSAMIGGMFPLLFGQGRAASLGGGLGGLAGGALGGGLGFGLSLFGTVIGSRVQEAADFRKEIDKLNTAIKGTGGTSVFTVEKIKELAKNLGVTKEEALQAAGSFEQFGAAARATLLQAFPDEETFNYFSNIKNNQSLLEGMLDMQKKIGFEQSQIAIEVLRTQGFRAAELFLLTKTLEKQKQARIDAAKEKNSKIGGGELLGDLGSMLQQIDEANINKEFEDMKKEAEELINKTKEWNRELEKAMMVSQIKDELIKLQDPMFQIVEAANAIGDAFSSSFKGIVSGSMSAQEALANLFKRTADHFLDMAAQILAAQIRAKIVGMFANAFATTAPAGAFGIGSKPTDTVSRHVAGHSSIQPKFASGGYVTRPTVGLIGEAGEDEYVIPASKMASSMQRYSAGARGDAVIAGGGSSYAGGGAGGSTTVNYSGPILNFNSEEFVPKSAVGQIIATATSQGAKAGENRTLSTLRNSRSARSRLGM